MAARYGYAPVLFPLCARCGHLSYAEVLPGPSCPNCGERCELVRRAA